MQRNILLLATLCILASVANCVTWVQIRPYTLSDCSDSMTVNTGIAWVLNTDSPYGCFATTSKWFTGTVPVYNATAGTAVFRVNIGPFTSGLPNTCPSLTATGRYDITYTTTNASLCQPITSMLPNTAEYPASNWGAYAKVETATNSVIFLNNIKLANLGNIIRMAVYNPNCTVVMGYYFVRRGYTHELLLIDYTYFFEFNCNSAGVYARTCDGDACFTEYLNTCATSNAVYGNINFYHQAGVCL